jgi:uncharacterized membrane protein YkoI
MESMRLRLAVLMLAACLGVAAAQAEDVTGAARAESGATTGATPPAEAAKAKHCFSRQEQKARIAAGTVMPLAKVLRPAKGRGEVLRARLCERNGRLVYLLTVLARDGKVVRAAVDANNGALIGRR